MKSLAHHFKQPDFPKTGTPLTILSDPVKLP